MQEQFNKLNLPFEFYDAIEGSSLTKEDMYKICDAETLRKHPQWLNKGAVACAVSHKLVYDIIIKQNIPEAFIMEDDMVIPNDLPDLLQSISNAKFFNEIVLLYFRSNRKIYFTEDGMRKLSNDYKLYYPVDKNNIPGSAAGYVISLEICKNLANIILPLKAASDSWKHYYQLGSFSKISVVYPIPLKDGLFKSEIDYVGAYQGQFTSLIFRLLNKYKVPVFYEYLRKKRRKREIEMTNFELVNKPHQFH